nr:MAG TPA: hypothetical protein [Microviridae sp.]
MNKCIIYHLGKLINIIGRNRIMKNTDRMNIGVRNYTTKILPKTNYLFQRLNVF